MLPCNFVSLNQRNVKSCNLKYKYEPLINCSSISIFLTKENTFKINIFFLHS